MLASWRYLSRLLPLGARIAAQDAKREFRFWMQRRHFTPYKVQRTFDDDRLTLFIGDPASRDWYDRIPDPHALAEIRFLRDRLVRPGSTVFEVGAHHGVFSTLLGRWVGSHGRVVAFEPCASNASNAKENIRLNGLTNVTIERKAVGSQQGSVCITAESNACIATSPRRHREVAELITLDHYAVLLPALVKIDVEGFEDAVLRGASRILSYRPGLAVEIHGSALLRYGTTVERVLRHLDALQDYEWFVLEEQGIRVVRCNFSDLPLYGHYHLFGRPRRPHPVDIATPLQTATWTLGRGGDGGKFDAPR